MFKGENEFSVGDRVKFKKSSLETGMIDAKEDDVFIIENFQDKAKTLALLEGKYFAIYNVEHLEHVKEQTRNNTEGQEIKWEGSQIDWQVGQEVFCLLRGKGFVESVDDNEGSPYTIGVDFGYTFDKYTIDGKIYDDHKGRVLFFSEPVITAELFPPKKPFKSVLKVGDLIAIKYEHCSDAVIVSFLKEDEECIYYAYNDGEKDYSFKENVSVYPLGEEIKFR